MAEEIVDSMLQCCYGNEISKEITASVEKLFQLFIAAEKYSISALKQTCAAMLIFQIEKMDLEFVLDMLRIIDEMPDAERLVDACYAYCKSEELIE